MPKSVHLDAGLELRLPRPRMLQKNMASAHPYGSQISSHRSMMFSLSNDNLCKDIEG